jgi:hypothetical protein
MVQCTWSATLALTFPVERSSNSLRRYWRVSDVKRWTNGTFNEFGWWTPASVTAGTNIGGRSVMVQLQDELGWKCRALLFLSYTPWDILCSLKCLRHILHAMITRSNPHRSYMMNLIVMSTLQLVELCWNFLDLKHLPFSDLKQIYYKCARKNTKNITRILYTFLCMLHAYYLLVHRRLLSLIVNQHHSKKLKI